MADTIQRAAARVIDAWDSTVLPVANDGRLQEAMEDLRAALAEQASEAANGDVLWLWKNGDHFLAFKHLYPCYSPGGDPMVLGEPFGRAEFRASHDRAAPAAAEQAEPKGVWRCVGADDSMRRPEECDLVGGETDMPTTPAAEQASAVQAVNALSTWRPVRLEFGVTMHRDHNPPSGGEWLKKDEVLAAVAGAAPAAEQAERKALETYLKECDDFAIVPDVGGAWAAAWRAARAENTTPTLREAAQQALEALEAVRANMQANAPHLSGKSWGDADNAITALRAALAEQAAEQAEPVALVSSIAGGGKHAVKVTWMGGFPQIGTKLYTTPPAPARQDPLFLLHTGQIDSGGEQDEWDIEANSWASVEEFCLAHPGQTIGLHPQHLPAAPITAAPAEGGAA